MTVQVTGEHAAVQTLRGYLKSLGYEVLDAASKAAADFVIQMEQGTTSKVALEGVRGQLAEEALHAIAGLTGVPIEWRVAIAGSERVLKIVAPAIHADAVGRGLLRALLTATGHGAVPAATGVFAAVARFFRKK
ncbi:MAG: hypothetical protein ABL995_17645 [Bryobacteraceae bacterium]